MTLRRGWVYGDARFASGPMLVSLGLVLFVLASIGSFRVHGDGRVFFEFLRQLFGEDTPYAVAYQFGTSLWNAPFYLAGKLFGEEEGFVAAAAAVSALATLYLGWRLLRRFELPCGPVVLLAAFFGSPLWFYVLFEPSYTHAFDTALLTAAIVAIFMLRDRPSVAAGLALAACAALLPITRYANAALVPFLLAPAVLYVPRRLAALVLVATAVFVGLLLALPLAAGIEYGAPPAVLNGEPSDPELDLLAPLKMLFTLHRGLFLWTPLTLLGLVGFALLLRRAGRDRATLSLLAAGAIALLGVHVMWGAEWDAGFSFSQRFLASLLPLELLGIAELVRRWRTPVVAAASATAVFSVFIGLNVYYGYRGQGGDGVDHILRLYTNGERSLPQLARIVGVDARERWRVLLP